MGCSRTRIHIFQFSPQEKHQETRDRSSTNTLLIKELAPYVVTHAKKFVNFLLIFTAEVFTAEVYSNFLWVVFNISC
jgi:hypothetical protein